MTRDSTFFALLRDGVRLSLLRAPKRTPLDAGLGSFLLLTLLVALLQAAWAWPLVQPPRMFQTDVVQTTLTVAVIELIIAWIVCAICERRALFWVVASWQQAASLLPSAVMALTSQKWGWGAAYAVGIWIALLVWGIAIVARLLWFLSGRRAWRTLASLAVALALTLAPWTQLEQHLAWKTDWQAKFAEDGDGGDFEEPGTLDDPERAMYAQGERLDASLDALAPQRPGVVDMYALAFGGDATEDVFRNEVEYVQQLFPRRFDAAGHVVALLNHPDTVETLPLATATNLDISLEAIGAAMDPAEDILFLYLTSHGSEDHQLYVNQPPLPLDQVDPEFLREALDASGIRWRVLVVSACYSGGFVDALRDPQTLVITAARKDRTSFGCGSESDITWFGNAFLVEALNRTTDFREAYDLAAAAIATREKEQKFDPSEPQWDAGDRILGQLAVWRAGLKAGAPVAFAPTVSAGGEDADDDAVDERGLVEDTTTTGPRMPTTDPRAPASSD